MPEPISSFPSAKVLERYRTITCLRMEAPPVKRAAKRQARPSDTVQISEEARERLRQYNEAKRDDGLQQEQMRRERDEAIRRSLEVLELGVESSKEVIRRAYRHLMGNYHPDKYSHLPPEFRELAERKARQIIDAYARLNE